MSHECFKNLKSDFKYALTLARGEFRRAIPVAMVRKVVEFVIICAAAGGSEDPLKMKMSGVAPNKGGKKKSQLTLARLKPLAASK